jgi:hypothetical protein
MGTPHLKVPRFKIYLSIFLYTVSGYCWRSVLNQLFASCMLLLSISISAKCSSQRWGAVHCATSSRRVEESSSFIFRVKECHFSYTAWLQPNLHHHHHRKKLKFDVFHFLTLLKTYSTCLNTYIRQRRNTSEGSQTRPGLKENPQFACDYSGYILVTREYLDKPQRLRQRGFDTKTERLSNRERFVFPVFKGLISRIQNSKSAETRYSTVVTELAHRRRAATTVTRATKPPPS